MDDANECASYMDKPVVNSMFCVPVEKDELITLIIRLNPNRSSGPDDNRPNLAKDVVIIVAEPLRHISHASASAQGNVL
jgi:hypothetical protein